MLLKIADTDFADPFGPIDRTHRDAWMAQRRAIEKGAGRPGLRRRAQMVRTHGLRSVRHIVEYGLRKTRLYERGIRNAAKVQRTDITMYLDSLPAAFDGYRILHITDCHFDNNPDLLDRLSGMLAGDTVDLCVFTGDYQDDRKCAQSCEDAAESLGALVNTFEQRDGALAVLGNHDSVNIVAPLEMHGVRVLANEWVTVARGGEQLTVTGLDDVHFFETPMAYRALAKAPEGFRIVLVHSPEAARSAAFHQHDLYLCGHTHGGQISLPGGRPIIAAHRETARYSAGRWACGRMAGYTNRGAGTTMIPVRFNAPPEIAVITLRRFKGRLT